MSCIAIIGAGIAGLTAAQRLQAAGHRVVLYDKSRGVGGRMATRRADGLSFDHGVPLLTATDERFAEQLDRWRARGVVASWGQGVVGVPGMTAPARAMAEELTVIVNRTIGRLAGGPGEWRLDGEEHPFDCVILAIPAPQAMALLLASDLGVPLLAEAVYTPCWTLLAAFDAPFSAPEDCLQNSTKPGRDPEPVTMVRHADAGWSRAHLEAPAETISRLMLADLPSPRYHTVHRWRYARVERPLSVDHLWEERLGLGLCGDFCLGDGVESAYLSGEALARRILEQE